MTDKIENLYEIIMKLNGPISPLGESHEDGRRFENLEQLIGVIDLILFDIEQIAAVNEDRVEFSMNRAGKTSREFLSNLKEFSQ